MKIVELEKVSDYKYQITLDEPLSDEQARYLNYPWLAPTDDPKIWIRNHGLRSELKIEDIQKDLDHAVAAHAEFIETRARIRAELLAKGHTVAMMSYSGYGDSGDIQDATTDEAGEFLWDVMWAIHTGFENNSGGNGEVTWDLKTDKITIDHNDVIEDYHNTVTEDL